MDVVRLDPCHVSCTCHRVHAIFSLLEDMQIAPHSPEALLASSSKMLSQQHSLIFASAPESPWGGYHRPFICGAAASVQGRCMIGDAPGDQASDVSRKEQRHVLLLHASCNAVHTAAGGGPGVRSRSCTSSSTTGASCGTRWCSRRWFRSRTRPCAPRSTRRTAWRTSRTLSCPASWTTQPSPPSPRSSSSTMWRQVPPAGPAALCTVNIAAMPWAGFSCADCCASPFSTLHRRL